MHDLIVMPFFVAGLGVVIYAVVRVEEWLTSMSEEPDDGNSIP